MSLQCDRCLEQVDLNQDENFEIVLKPQEDEPEPAEETLLTLAELQNDFYEENGWSSQSCWRNRPYFQFLQKFSATLIVPVFVLTAGST